jgi:hypothetical protein
LHLDPLIAVAGLVRATLLALPVASGLTLVLV